MAQYRRQVNPVQYVSQYDPLMNQMIERDLEKRDTAFKQTYASMAEEQARQGDIFFIDNEAKENLAQGFNKRKQAILEKYNGEYDKAAPELSNLVAEERSNPLYNLNLYQQKKLDEQNKSELQWGKSNTIVHKGVPTKLTQNGIPLQPTDFDYNIEKRSDYIGELLKSNRGIAATLKEKLPTASPELKGFLVQKSQAGWNALSPKEKEAAIKFSGEMLDKETTFSRDTKYGNSLNKQIYTGAEYARQVLPILFGSKTSQKYIRDNRNEGTGTSGNPYKMNLDFQGKQLTAGAHSNFKDYNDFENTSENNNTIKSRKKTSILNQLSKIHPEEIKEYRHLLKKSEQSQKAGPGKEQAFVEIGNKFAHLSRGEAKTQAQQKEDVKVAKSGVNMLPKEADRLNELKNLVISWTKPLITQDNLSQNLNWYGPAYTSASSKDLTAMNKNIAGLQSTMDNIDLSNFQILDAPEKADMFKRGVSKTMDQLANNEYYQDLKKNKRITAYTIDDNENVLLQLQDSKGNFYTVQPVNTNITRNITRNLQSGIFEGAISRKETIDNLNSYVRNNSSSKQTFNQYIDELFNQANIPRNLNLDRLTDKQKSELDPQKLQYFYQIDNKRDGLENAIERNGFDLNTKIQQLN